MSKKTKKILSYFISILIIFISVMPFLIHADDATGQNPMNIVITNPFNCGGSTNCTIVDLVKSIVNNILIPIGGVLAVLMIMYAGFLYVTAGGSDAQIKKAHQALLYAVIGAAILLGAWVISQAISATIDQLKA